MKRTILILTLFAVSSGCVDTIPNTGSNEGYETQTQAVVVHPEFRIAGIDEIPEDLLVKGLDLTVSEIRFAPTLGDDLAYSTQEPMFVSFDIEGGEFVKTEVPVTLPEAGTYIVSIRLEPIENDEFESRSFAMSGYVAEEAAGTSQEEKYEPTPQPILFHEKEEKSDRKFRTRHDDGDDWTPFRYESRRSVFFTFNDVQFEPGEQFLTFDFDAANWGGNVIDSISKAVRNTAPEAADEVDVTKTVESNGDDFARLIETGSVRAHGAF